MKTSMDSWLRIQGLKEHKTRKPIMYWQALWSGTCIDEHHSLAILKAKYGDNCKYNPIR